MKYGKPNCRCTKEHPHAFPVVTYKKKGKTRTGNINEALHAEALLLARSYKKHKVLLEELTRVNLEILKSR